MNTNPEDLEKISAAKVERLEELRLWNSTWIGRFESHVMNVFVGVVMVPFMRLLQHTRIHHWKRLKQVQYPAVLLPNHVSILDDFFLTPLLIFWPSLFNYKLMPYHAPEEKNFFKGFFLSYMMKRLKCIPLTRGAGFMQPGILRLLELSKAGNLLWIYPEGGRTRTGDIVRGKAGVGMILYRTHAQALPIYHHGLHNVMPIGSKFPKLFQKVDIIIGNPIDLSEFYELPDEPRTWQAIADRITEGMAALRDELAQEQANKR